MKRVCGMIDKLKQGGDISFRHQNPYLEKALNLQNYLMTEKDFASGYQNIFELFDNNNPIILEVGCYMGKTLLEMSQKNPQFNFIGLDITYKRVVKSAEKLNRLQFKNVKIMICDAHHFLKTYVEENSLQGICIFFPDPWPKARHEKNRLLNSDFINILHQKIKPNGFVWFKSDSQKYYDETEKLLLEKGFHSFDNEDNSLRQFPMEFEPSHYETNFQELFRKKGIPFYYRVFKK